MKKLLLLLIIPLLFSCNNDNEKVKELEQRIERLEKIYNIPPELNGGPDFDDSGPPL